MAWEPPDNLSFNFHWESEQHATTSDLFPYYKLVPKDKRTLLAFRHQIIRDAYNGHAEDIWTMCARDGLFYVNAFVATYDPRITDKDGPQWIPFNTFPAQDRAFEKMCRAMGEKDFILEKSREIGASWLILAFCDWRWRFHETQSIQLISRKEHLVDRAEDLDALMPKLDGIEDELPDFLKVPDRNRMKLHLFNPRNHSTIDGCATTGDIGRGGRRLFMFIDELAAFDTSAGYAADSASFQNTNSRFICSTPNGIGNVMFDLREKAVSEPDAFILETLHWTEDPRKWDGMYTTKGEKLLVLDEDYEFPEGYPYVLDGKVRSPWYDRQEKRAATRRAMAQEIDIDYVGAGDPFFDLESMKKLRAVFAEEPTRKGTLVFNPTTCDPARFEEHQDGMLSLWLDVLETSSPPHSVYCIGADISGGTGASQSCLEIFDRVTGQQVGEYITKFVRAEEFAKHAVAVAKWFHNARLGWERNGRGQDFGAKVEEVGYANLFWDYKPNGKPQEAPGLFTTKAKKQEMLADLQRAMDDGTLLVRSEELYRQIPQYKYASDGSITHVREKSNPDPSGARDNHGDAVIGACVAHQVYKATPRAMTMNRVIPENSYAGRKLRDQREARQAEWVSF